MVVESNGAVIPISHELVQEHVMNMLHLQLTSPPISSMAPHRSGR